MDSIKFDYSKICNFVTKEEMIALYPEARQALKSLKASFFLVGSA